MKKDLLTEEELIFLKNLGHELKTQDNLATAKPLVFKIRYTERTPGIDIAFAEDLCLINNSGNVYYELKDAIEHIESNCFEDESDTWENFLKNIDLKEADLEDIYDVCEILEKNYPNEDWKVTGFSEGYVYKGEFLTHSSAKEHLTSNYYHYGSDAIVYIEHGWRNPVLEKLLNIIEKFDE